MSDVAELAKENEQLKAQLSQARQQLTANQSQVSQLQSYIDQLEQALILARQQRFGSSSEKSRVDQLGLFNEAEELTDQPESSDGRVDEPDEFIKVPAHTRKKRGRKPLPEFLPRVEVIHDVAGDEKVCAIHGQALTPIGDKVSEQLDIVPAKVQVLRHIRKQYTCPCCEGNVVTATKPKQPIEKSVASAGTLAAICVHKYADGLPLYRQATMFERAGIEIDRSTLANWMIRCGELVQPLVNLLRDELLSESVIHMDESPLQVLNEAGKPAQSKSYMWVQASTWSSDRPVVLFDYSPSRGATVPRQLLEGYEGALMVDGYDGYDGVCRGSSLLRLGCWAHARRKFVDAAKVQGKSKKSTKADFGLKLINKLYSIERQAKDLQADQLKLFREEKAVPVLDKLHQWLMQTVPTVPPKMALGRALSYLHNQWPRLIRYLDDSQYPIDNNRVENAIRPFAVGRKNWLFSTSVAGAKASANLYSIIESAKANQVEPYGYLKQKLKQRDVGLKTHASQIFTKLPNVETVEDIEILLPWKDKS